jgi:hypothetical protein
MMDIIKVLVIYMRGFPLILTPRLAAHVASSSSSHVCHSHPSVVFALESLMYPRVCMLEGKKY